MTTVELRRKLPIPFSAAADYVSEFFREHPQLEVHGPACGTTVTTGFQVVDDATDGARIHEAVVFAWFPQYRLFPALSATLRVRPDYGQAALLLNAIYHPPFGRLGAAFDRLVGRRIARRTFSALLDDIEAFAVKRYETYAADLRSRTYA